MKFFAVALLVAGSLFVTTVARADGDDDKWIKVCVKDNEDAKVSKEVVLTYCTCMNNKMGDNENQSISKWEKTHTNERDACEKAAGWK